MPLASELPRVAEGDAGRVGENQSGFSFQAASVLSSTILQPFDGLVVKITYQYPSHSVFSMQMLS
jgi:hypothetical protein